MIIAAIDLLGHVVRLLSQWQRNFLTRTDLSGVGLFDRLAAANTSNASEVRRDSSEALLLVSRGLELRKTPTHFISSEPHFLAGCALYTGTEG